ncbi:MAG: hypothetical protein Q9168_001577 [Polycauliona sp. 1 TL-2023]
MKQELMMGTVYHSQVATNGTNPRSFPYNEYIQEGYCHMQLENLAGDDSANDANFDITSDDAVQPQTWGVQAIRLLDGGVSATVAEASSTISGTMVTTLSASLSLLPSTTFSATKSSPLANASTPTSSAVPSGSPTSPSESLSDGAIAGVSIGSVFCALALVIVLLLFRNALRPKHLTGRDDPSPSQEGTWPEPIAETNEGPYEVNGIARPHELDGLPCSELSCFPDRVELDVALQGR